MLEELGHESTNIRKKIINDLPTFINNLISNNYEIIFLIDANEPLIFDIGIVSSCQNTKIIDSITLRHEYRNIPNIHQRGSKRRDFCFCTDKINNFITKYAITSFDFFSSCDHRGICLNIQL